MQMSQEDAAVRARQEPPQSNTRASRLRDQGVRETKKTVGEVQEINHNIKENG